MLEQPYFTYDCKLLLCCKSCGPEYGVLPTNIFKHKTLKLFLAYILFKRCEYSKQGQSNSAFSSCTIWLPRYVHVYMIVSATIAL